MVKRLLTFLVALAIAVIGVVAAGRRSAARPDPAPPRSSTAQVGRYQLAVSSPAYGREGESAPARAYVIDTVTGQVWIEAWPTDTKHGWQSLGTPRRPWLQPLPPIPVKAP